MKVEFEDKSYVEVSKSNTPGKVILTIVAKSGSDTLAVIANSVELTIEQLNSLIKND